MRHIIQKEVNECGIACAQMLLENDLKESIDYYEIRNNVLIEEKGVRLDNLISYLQTKGDYKAYKCEFNFLPNFPFITIIKNKKNQSHYVLVWKKDHKYFYVSNPCESFIKKIRISKFKKFYEGIIIYNLNTEVEIEKNNKLKLNETKKIVFPLVMLNIIEITIFCLSLLYLFNIEEFSILKLIFFFSILIIQIIIYLLKNNIVNLIDEKYDNLISLNESNNLLLKENVKNIYYLKNKKSIYYNKIIPSFIIVIFSLFVFFYLHYLFALCMLIFVLIYYFLEKHYCKKKLFLTSKCQKIEREFNEENEEIVKKFNKLKKSMKKLNKAYVTQTIVAVFYRQAILIFIMLFFSLIKQQEFVFMGIYLCFYMFDGISIFADYNSDKSYYKYVLYNFNYKNNQNIQKK